MKQTLEQAAIEAVENHYGMDYDGKIHEMYILREAFEAGAEWQAKQMAWISVEETPPPVGIDVIHTNINTGKRYYGQVNKVGTLMLGWTPYGEITATHYMLVPPFTFDEILNESELDKK